MVDLSLIIKYNKNMRWERIDKMSEQLMGQLEETEDESVASYVRVDKLLYPCMNVKEGGYYRIEIDPKQHVCGTHESYLIDEDGRDNFGWQALISKTLFKFNK